MDLLWGLNAKNLNSDARCDDLTDNYWTIVDSNLYKNPFNNLQEAGDDFNNFSEFRFRNFGI